MKMETQMKFSPFEIDQILDKKIVCGRIRYLVKRRRSRASDDFCTCWEPIESLSNARQFIAKFERKQKPERRIADGKKSFAPTMRITRNALKISCSHFSTLEPNEIKKQLSKVFGSSSFCIICCGLVKEESLTACGHLFCKICIDKWSRLNPSCPICFGGLLEC